MSERVIATVICSEKYVKFQYPPYFTESRQIIIIVDDGVLKYNVEPILQAQFLPITHTILYDTILEVLQGCYDKLSDAFKCALARELLI